MRPSSPEFGLSYQDVWIPVEDAAKNPAEQLHGWWFNAAKSAESSEVVTILPEEPQQILSSPKTILYFCGVGRNMGDYNYLSRVAAFRQLGFSVLVFDYRGYGQSQGDFPQEQQLYADANAAWQYLRNTLAVPAEQIILYGESLGGAIALNLAIEQPEAAGLIMQSSFTSMSAAVKHKPIGQWVPVDLILTEQFDSLTKMRSLTMPVLFLHGSQDPIVPVEMSHQLYAAAQQPKQQLIIPAVEHVSIYQPGANSYLKAIQQFEAAL